MMNAEFITTSDDVAVTLGELATDSTNENALGSLGGHGIGIIAIPRLSLQDDSVTTAKEGACNAEILVESAKLDERLCDGDGHGNARRQRRLDDDR